jgi:uncharacterized membrane protein
MLAHLIPQLQVRASGVARTAAIGLIGGLFLCVGLMFLTLAGWLYLTAIASPMVAALIFGGLYVGVGSLMFAVITMRARARRRARVLAAETAAATAAPAAALTGKGGLASVLIAFATGLAAAQKMRS